MHMKNKLKSEKFISRKFFKQKSFCHNYEFKLGNFSLEFITFKLQYFWASQKNPILRRWWVSRKTNIKGGFPKKGGGGLDSLRI